MAGLKAGIFLIYCAFIFVSLTFAKEGPIQNNLLNHNISEANYINALQAFTILKNELHKIRDQSKIFYEQLTKFYNQSDNQLRILQQSITNKSIEDVNRETRQEIIEKIKADQFITADRKIKEIGQSSPMIRMIVHDIYANNTGNFELLRGYGNVSKDVEIRYSTLSALWYEMKETGHMNVYNLMSLYETFSSKVANQVNLNDNMESNVIRIQNEISDAIVLNASEILKKAILARNYGGNSDIKKLANSLYNFHDGISDKTIRKVIDDVYDVTPKTILVHYMYENDMIPQIVGAMVHIFKKLQDERDVDNPAIMIIAQYIKNLKDMKNYDGLVSTEKKFQVQNVIKNLPESVYALYFSAKVCIKNVYYNVYIYSPHRQDKVSDEGRYVLTWNNDEKSIEPSWFAKFYEDFTFQFVHEYYSHEYMYASKLEPYNEEYRYVLTWTQGESPGQTSAWIVDLYSDEVSLRNKYFQEYLCVSDYLDNYDSMRYVFTKEQNFSSNASDCLWKIEACA